MTTNDGQMITEALTSARAAHAAATEALARAEEAAVRAGVTRTEADAPPAELRVQRIRVVEPDGTTRMIIGNSSMSDIAPIRGEDRQHPGRGKFGGILFCNDEGTEAGGLVYAGGSVDGEAQQVGFWTVDDFEQNEGFRMGGMQSGQSRAKWIEFADQPYFSLVDFMAAAEGKTGTELTELQQEFWPAGTDGNGLTRMRLSRESDGTVSLSLRDGQGVERIRFAVPAEGEPIMTATRTDGTTQTLLDSTGSPLTASGGEDTVSPS